jgi:hypothetical protein
VFRGGAPASGNASITGGSITGTNAPYVLSQSAIPFIHLSSGSVSAVGAISAITALPRAYAHAYCYFPANILATSIAAGWHYCTFSTTTAGTAFLNTYTSGTPTIPAAPTAVTDGKGAFTGDTTERDGPVIAMPANSMGANGSVRINVLWTATNNANAKTIRTKFGATTYTAASAASTADIRTVTDIHNRGLTNSQVGAAVPIAQYGAGSTMQTSAIDTTAAVNLAISPQKATATDNLVVEAYRIEVMYAQ